MTRLLRSYSLHEDSAIETLARRLESMQESPDTVALEVDETEVQALEDAIAESPASNATESAIQLMLAAAYLERAREGLANPDEALLSRLYLLIRSALSGLVEGAEVDLSDFGLERYAPSHTDPFRDRRVVN